MKTKKYLFDDPVKDRRWKKMWALVEKNSVYKGMRTQQILEKIREC